MDDNMTVGLLGARSLVGHCVLKRLVQADRSVIAFTRNHVCSQLNADVVWRNLDRYMSSQAANTAIRYWLCIAPIWVMPDYFKMLEACGAKRVVVLSSTSRFTKIDSSNHQEKVIVHRLADAEERVKAWATNHRMEWVILRPTLIYGMGRDKNISEIMRFILRFGFFPLLGQAQGLRQPIHAEDVAAACVSALELPHAAKQAYNISGGETLTYREMVARVFSALGRPERLVTAPVWAFRLAVAALRLMPSYRDWSAAMVERMNRDIVFDHGDAVRDLGFKPRCFSLTVEDCYPLVSVRQKVSPQK